MKQEEKLELTLDMTSHAGWNLLMGDVQEKVDHLKEYLSYPKNFESYELGMQHGCLFVYRELLGLRESLRVALEPKEENVEDE